MAGGEMPAHLIGDPLHLCTVCSPAHYDNCPECWGFGVLIHPTLGAVPVSASRAHDRQFSNIHPSPCPRCHSTIDGAVILASEIS